MENKEEMLTVAYNNSNFEALLTRKMTGIYILGFAIVNRQYSSIPQAANDDL